MTKPRPNTRNTWQGWEDDILRRHYPDGGYAACRESLPNREGAAIHQRCHNLGIHSLKRRYVAKRYAKPPPDNPTEVKVRVCLKCREYFLSHGSHNQVCRPCKVGPDWQAGGYMDATAG